MPNLNIEMFENEPKVGDKIKVIGVIKSISDDGKVEASYDEVEILDKKAKKDRSDKEDESNDDSMDESYDSADLSLDTALEKSFPNTQ